jgi:hypothetical protein
MSLLQGPHRTFGSVNVLDRKKMIEPLHNKQRRCDQTCCLTWCTDIA